jgi:DNA helicase-2/ATP-dependent DNA helicase PcrA
VEDDQRPRRLARFVHGWLRERTGDVGEGAATPLELLVERLGLDVAVFHPESRRSGTLGWLEPDEDLIYLREGLPESIRRFTLAHELGHALLHRPRPLGALGGMHDAGEATVFGGEMTEDCGEADLGGAGEDFDAGEELLRPGETYSARARRESEANAFAAELLLPLGLFRAAYEAAVARAETASGRGDAIREVARTFGVSEEVVLRRLTSLLMAADGDDERKPASTEGSATGRVVGLDRWQEEAARSETPALVIAGPGTGKTSTLVGRVAYLARERDVAPQRILALTFSNKAAREMRERLSALLAPPGTDDAGLPRELAPRALPTVATIHAFCGDLLRRYAPLVGLRPDFRLVTGTEGYLLLRGLVAELELDQYQSLAEPGYYFPALLSTISRAKDELAGPEEYAQAAAGLAASASTPEEEASAERAREVALVYGHYQAALGRRGDLDFGDVVRLAVKLLREQPGVLAEVRARYGQILVDEFQDVNRAMGVLLRTLAGEDGPLWAVGDADQAIYRFRGASPANLARFAIEYKEARVHTLRRNYRSVAPILDAAAGVASALLGSRNSEPLEAVRAAPGGSAVFLASADDSGAELAGLAHSIRNRLAEGRSLADQAVLCRTRKHAQQVAAALKAGGIRAELAAPLLEQNLVKDVLGVCSLLAETNGSGLLRAGRLEDHAFTTAEARAVIAEARARGQAPVALLRKGLDGLTGIEPSGAAGMATLAEVLTALRTAPDVATALTRYTFGLTSLGGRLLAGIARGDERAIAEAAQLAELLQLARTFDDLRATTASGAWGGNAEARLWPDFFDYLRIVGRLHQEPGRAGGDPARGRDAVRVLTVHASKGLEFPVVYLPGLAERRFPTQRRYESAPLPSALIELADGAKEEVDTQLLEEACLFYVAVTRARDELVLSVAERYGRLRYKPSPFLAPIERRLGTTLRRVTWAPARLGGARLEAGGESDDAVLGDAAPIPLGAAERETGEPLRSSAIETYARCPRQYAYRYVYGLRPREVGMVTLRRALHETLRALERSGMTSDADGAEMPALPALAEALRLFDANWAAAAASDAGSPEGDVAADAAETEAPPFDAVYRRHGRSVVERAWQARAARPAEEEGAIGRRAGSTDFERGVSVEVGGARISVTLDRVEPLIAEVVPSDAEAGRASGRSPQPAVFVRHRLGRSSSPQADLRALFYALAAEQRPGEAPATLLHHNLSTDERTPATLNPRQRARLTETLHDALDGLARADFAPRPVAGACESCPFLLICPA